MPFNYLFNVYATPCYRFNLPREFKNQINLICFRFILLSHTYTLTLYALQFILFKLVKSFPLTHDHIMSEPVSGASTLLPVQWNLLALRYHPTNDVMLESE